MSMIHSAPQIAKAWLIAQGLGTTPPSADWSTFAGGMPEDPTKALCLYDAPGLLQGRLQASGETVEHFGIEIRIRSSRYKTGYARASEICDAADFLHNETVSVLANNYVIAALTRKSSILYIGPEAGNKRESFKILFLASIKAL